MCSIPVLTRAQIEQQLLEDACDEATNRRKRQTQMVNIPNTVVERALGESIPRFYDVSIKIIITLSQFGEHSEMHDRCIYATKQHI